MLNYEQTPNEMIISYFGPDGKIAMERFPITSGQKFAWKVCDANDPKRARAFLSQRGEPVKPVPAKFLDKYRVLEFMMNLPDASKERIFSNHMPNKWFMDIETEIVSDRPDASNPMGKVLTNAFCNQKGNLYLQGLQPLTALQVERLEKRVNEHLKSCGKVWKLKYNYYPTEYALMTDLMCSKIPQMPVIMGWNFLKFDWQYLWRRCKMLQIDPTRTSPTGGSTNLTLKDKFNKDNKDVVPIPLHRGVIDYMSVWEKWDTFVKYKSGASLDFVAKEVLGVEKVHSTLTLDKLYAADYETFLFYNAVDTCLVALIDEKLQTFRTMMTLAREGRVQLHDAPFASVVIENLFYEILFSKERQAAGLPRVVFLRDEHRENGETYTGGYVKDPVRGKHADVAIADFVSHYPSTTAAFNIGNDTLVGMLYNHEEYTEKRAAEIEYYIAEKAKLREPVDPARVALPDAPPPLPAGYTHYVRTKSGELVLLDGKDHVRCESGAVYDKKTKSSMRQVISQLFGQRVEAKYAGGTIDQEIEYLRSLLKVPQAN